MIKLRHTIFPVLAGRPTWLVAFGLASLFAPAPCSHANPREYLQQYLPITPLLPPDTPSRNYLQRTHPMPPWKPVAEPPPLFEEAVPLEAPTEPVTPPTETNPAAGHPSTPPETWNPTLPPLTLPSLHLSADDKHLAPTPPEITISPWFTISSLPPSQPGAGGDMSAWLGSNAAPALLRRSIQGGASDVYIPYPITPGGNPPPASSVIIYTQPDQ